MSFKFIHISRTIFHIINFKRPLSLTPDMETQSDLYYQSQQFITPIVDYIPVQNQFFPESARWRLKAQLDQSRHKVVNPSVEHFQQVSSLRIQSRNDRLQTESATNENDKKTTSIMQGNSFNTIPSNELSIHTIKDNLRSYLTYNPPKNIGNQTSYLQFFSNQNSNQIRAGMHHQRKRSRSIDEEKGMHFMKERNKLLRSIDKSLEMDHQRIEKERYELKELGKERKQILSEILDKLESNSKQKREVELVKSNCKDTEVSINERSKEKESVFTKKMKKWVEVKNALKDAASESTQFCISNSKVLQQHKIVQNPISEWQNSSQQDNFSSPTLITSLTNTRPNYQDYRKESAYNNLYTGHKGFPSNRKQEQIFTFSNLQNPVQKHIKNVSITISQSSSKQSKQCIPAPAQPEAIIAECILCKIIGKRCSFH